MTHSTHNLKLLTSELNGFHQMLKKTTGRYIYNPIYLGNDRYSIDYTHDDSEEAQLLEKQFFDEMYRLRNLKVKEKYSNSVIKTFFRRLKFWKQ
jgi:hypothetical protein